MKPYEVFSRRPDRKYGLVEVMRRESPMVEKGPENTLFTWPHLLVWEVLLFLGVNLLVLLMSVFIQAPLRVAANPNVTENPAKAPWYFLNLQELLLHMNPSLAGVILPTLVILFLMSIPYLDRSVKDVGLWFSSRNGKRIAIFSTIYPIPLLVGLILFNQYIRVGKVVDWGLGLLPASWLEKLPPVVVVDIIPKWIIPIGVMVALSAGLYALIRPLRPNARETLVAYFTAFMVTWFVLTIFGTFFRGLGMNLTLPWQLPPGALTF